MNSLVELIRSNQRLNELDMSNTTNSLLNNLYNRRYAREEDTMPIEVSQKKEWDTVEGNGIIYLNKLFEFKMTKHLLYFVNETIKVCEEKSHFPEIIITDGIVDVRLFTKDINDVTEVDLLLSKKIVEIFSEIKSLF